MKRITLLSAILYCTLALTSTSCATLLSKKNKPLKINSNPPGAYVYMDGINKGTTPLILNIFPEKGKTFDIRVEKNGKYQEYQITSKIGKKWLIMDIGSVVLLGPVPIIVDAITKEWRVLSEEELNVVF